VRYIDKLKGALDTLDEDVINKAARFIARADMVITAGNGGSSTVASHMAEELTKGCDIPSVCLTDSTGALSAYYNDLPDKCDVFKEYCEDITRNIDKVTVIVYSGSGNSSNIVSLVRYALEEGYYVVAITGYNDNKVDRVCAGYGILPVNICIGVDDMQIAEDVMTTISHIICKKLGLT
jgi:D-sedoheptulose 7-phosphate isomerase